MFDREKCQHHHSILLYCYFYCITYLSFQYVICDNTEYCFRKKQHVRNVCCWLLIAKAKREKHIVCCFALSVYHTVVQQIHKTLSVARFFLKYLYTFLQFFFPPKKNPRNWLKIVLNGPTCPFHRLLKNNEIKKKSKAPEDKLIHLLVNPPATYNLCLNKTKIANKCFTRIESFSFIVWTSIVVL